MGSINYNFPLINNLTPLADNIIAKNLAQHMSGLLNIFLVPTLNLPNLSPKPGTLDWKLKVKNNPNKLNIDWGNLASTGASIVSLQVVDKLNPFDEDSELGRNLGTLFSLGVSSAGNTLASNALKNIGLAEGLTLNVGLSVAGAGVGIAANYLGKGINALGGDSKLSRALGQGIATGVGSIGGSLITGGLMASSLSKLFAIPKAMNSAKAGLQAALTAYAGARTIENAAKVTEATLKVNSLKGLKALSLADKMNLAGLAGTVVGSAIGAATGPSLEYGGKYGGITLGLDITYDLASLGTLALGPAGALISGGMALNKGLSNLFGSTSGMTVQDAILGSAFMPAPVKWLNMWGSSKTGTFNKQSWQNSEKATNFMQNAFGNLQSKFDRAREEAGKTYGTFSLGARREAQKNIDFANRAWGQILDMADLNELLNIRSLIMSSINNLRYALNINGGFSRLAVGKQGMKIFNNATNHNIGMRLLSGAALIDNKQMILCSAVD